MNIVLGDIARAFPSWKTAFVLPVVLHPYDNDVETFFSPKSTRRFFDVFRVNETTVIDNVNATVVKLGFNNFHFAIKMNLKGVTSIVYLCNTIDYMKGKSDENLYIKSINKIGRETRRLKIDRLYVPCIGENSGLLEQRSYEIVYDNLNYPWLSVNMFAPRYGHDIRNLKPLLLFTYDECIRDKNKTKRKRTFNERKNKQQEKFDALQKRQNSLFDNKKQL